MTEEHAEIPATDEPNVTADENTAAEVTDNAPEASPTTEVESPSDEKSAAASTTTEVQEAAAAEQGGENAPEPLEEEKTEESIVSATEVQATDKVENGDEGAPENKEEESNEAKPEDAPAGEGEKEGVKDGGDEDKEDDGTGERKEETEGDQTTAEGEENKDPEKAVSRSEPDPDASEHSEQQTDEKEATSPLPESSTFGEGERPETPVVAVTDPLSREGSPVQKPPHSIPPGTPERLTPPVIQEDEEGYEEEEGEEEQMVPREELVEFYQAAHAEREQLQTTNTQFQHKLAEYFRKKKTDDQRQEMDKNVTDQEQRYLKYMSNLEELRKQEEEERARLLEQLEELRNKKDEKLSLVDSETHHFAEFKKQTALNAINSRTGKPILPKDVEQYLLNEVKKEDEVKQVRLDNIKLKNRLKKREQQLKAKEELAEGLHLIDFEQLKIENQTYNEKIEERNEELLKLRKKITSTVQVLTHVKEKLQFVQAENHVQKAKLKDVEELVAKKRDILSRTKKARDSLRIDNQRQSQKCGLLGNKPLLRDFEERKDEGDDLRARLEYLKRQHAELTLDSNGLRRKIEEARSVRN